jgi:hypothetical protein
MTPNDSPVMAVGEALAVLEADADAADDEQRASREQARATFAAMAAEVEALRALSGKLHDSHEAALARITRLTARAEGEPK